MKFLKHVLAGLGFALIGAGSCAATFNQFAPATGVLKGNSSTYVTTAATSADIRGLWTGTCDASTFLRGDGACATVATAGANPSAMIGLTPINGVSTFFMRADAAPSLNQAITPTWTGTHTFATTSSSQIVLNKVSGSGTDRLNTILSYGPGTGTPSFGVWRSTDADPGVGVQSVIQATRLSTGGGAWGALSFGNSTDNPNYFFLGSGPTLFSGNVTIPNLTVTGTCTGCGGGGGGGSPAGSNTQIQYNNFGSFGADSALTWTPSPQTFIAGAFQAFLTSSPTTLTLKAGNNANLSIIAGSDGNPLSLQGGGGGPSVVGGSATLKGGLGFGTNAGGNVLIVGGPGQSVSAGAGGNVSVKGGDGGLSGTGNGGSLSLSGGAPGTSGGAPGTVSLSTNNFTRITLDTDGSWDLAGNVPGSSRQILMSNGASAPPTWQNAAGIGTSPVAGGFVGTSSNCTLTSAIGTSSCARNSPGVYTITTSYDWTVSGDVGGICVAISDKGPSGWAVFNVTGNTTITVNTFSVTMSTGALTAADLGATTPIRFICTDT